MLTMTPRLAVFMDSFCGMHHPALALGWAEDAHWSRARHRDIDEAKQLRHWIRFCLWRC